MKRLAILLAALVLFINSITSASASEKSQQLAKFEQLIVQHQGKVIYLDFWASWCIPCRQSFPWMNQLQKDYQQQGLTIITVNLDADLKNAQEFLAQYPANFTVFYDPKGYVAREFKLPGMPSSYIYNRQGKIVARHVGFNQQKAEQYQQKIEQLLK